VGSSNIHGANKGARHAGVLACEKRFVVILIGQPNSSEAIKSHLHG
jgi:hypothetical protein